MNRATRPQVSIEYNLSLEQKQQIENQSAQGMPSPSGKFRIWDVQKITPIIDSAEISVNGVNKRITRDDIRNYSNQSLGANSGKIAAVEHFIDVLVGDDRYRTMTPADKKTFCEWFLQTGSAELACATTFSNIPAHIKNDPRLMDFIISLQERGVSEAFLSVVLESGGLLEAISRSGYLNIYADRLQDFFGKGAAGQEALEAVKNADSALFEELFLRMELKDFKSLINEKWVYFRNILDKTDNTNERLFLITFKLGSEDFFDYVYKRRELEDLLKPENKMVLSFFANDPVNRNFLLDLIDLKNVRKNQMIIDLFNRYPDSFGTVVLAMRGVPGNTGSGQSLLHDLLYSTNGCALLESLCKRSTREIAAIATSFSKNTSYLESARFLDLAAIVLGSEKNINDAITILETFGKNYFGLVLVLNELRIKYPQSYMQHFVSYMKEGRLPEFNLESILEFFKNHSNPEYMKKYWLPPSGFDKASLSQLCQNCSELITLYNSSDVQGIINIISSREDRWEILTYLLISKGGYNFDRELLNKLIKDKTYRDMFEYVLKNKTTKEVTAFLKYFYYTARHYERNLFKDIVSRYLSHGKTINEVADYIVDNDYPYFFRVRSDCNDPILIKFIDDPQNSDIFKLLYQDYEIWSALRGEISMLEKFFSTPQSRDLLKQIIIYISSFGNSAEEHRIMSFDIFSSLDDPFFFHDVLERFNTGESINSIINYIKDLRAIDKPLRAYIKNNLPQLLELYDNIQYRLIFNDLYQVIGMRNRQAFEKIMGHLVHHKYLLDIPSTSLFFIDDPQGHQKWQAMLRHMFNRAAERAATDKPYNVVGYMNLLWLNHDEVLDMNLEKYYPDNIDGFLGFVEEKYPLKA